MTNPASPPMQAEGVAEQRAQSDLTNKVGAPLAPQQQKIRSRARGSRDSDSVASRSNRVETACTQERPFEALAEAPRKEHYMYATVRRYEGIDQSRKDELTSKVEAELMPRLSKLPGFGGYYL